MLNIKEKYFIKSLLQILLFGWMFFFAQQTKAAITNVEQFSAAGNINNITVKWQKSTLQETEGIVLLRKENSCPANASDGTEIYRGNGNGFIDEDANKKTSYCYAAYVQDASGYVSQLKTSGPAQRKTVGEYVWLILENNLFMILGLFAIAVLAWLNVLKKNFLQKK